jgi:glycosyltransferase involved in cell wall biosynthesis
MRILWINHRDPKHPEAGGAEVHLREVGKRLVERGHEVTLICERFADSTAEDFIDGINVKRVGNKYTIHMITPILVTKMAQKFDVIIDDIAHAVPWWSTLVTSRPVLGIVHHVHLMVSSVELPLTLSMVAKMAEGSIKYTYKELVAVSETTKKDLVKLLGVNENRIRVIFYGVDHEVYNPGKEKFQEPTILWLGRIKKYKNINHLIIAFNMVKEKVPDAKLIIAGEGDYEQKLKELISTLKLKGVVFTGKVSGERKIELLRKSWVLAMTSITEGWGMSILEAAACGTPAIGYNSGAIGEAIIHKKTGLLVNYGDIETLADKLHWILIDDKLRKNLSAGALTNSYNFDWDKNTTETLEVIRKITE